MSQPWNSSEERKDDEKHNGKLSSVEELRKVKSPEHGLTSDEIKEEEKQKGLVDEDHPFPSKGN
ncbi:hypothetical protein D3C72_67930 [compost metagenome]